MLIHKAIQFATTAHQGQVRKGSTMPYIVHPFEVCQILTLMNAEENVIIAGLLHDTIEDTSVTYEDICDNFSITIANLVIANTEDKRLSWEERKLDTINFLRDNDSFGIVQIAFADKLSNLKSIYYDFNTLGIDVFNRFKRGYNEQKWYYGELINVFDIDDLEPWLDDYKNIYNKIFVK